MYGNGKVSFGTNVNGVRHWGAIFPHCAVLVCIGKVHYAPAINFIFFTLARLGPPI